MSVATRISISAVAITRSLAPTVCGVLPVVGTTVLPDCKVRDDLARAYFGIDDDIAWSVVVEEVPALLPHLILLRSRL